jgi:alpha-amylase
MQLVTVVALALLCASALPTSAQPPPAFNGAPGDVMLQGFHWTSSQHFDGKSWYRIVRENAQAIRDAGFDDVWLPPPSKSAAAEGYLPTEWNVLDSQYGTRAELKAAIAALKPAHALADIVVNHRCGTQTGGADFTNPAFADNRAAVVWKDESGVGGGHGDSGDGLGAARDLDHTTPSVQAEVVKWLRMLHQQIGFDGWRFDMVKGYFGGFVGAYDDATRPSLSVGEYWDTDPQHVIEWIDQTGGRSMAFDFPTRDRLRRALSEHRLDLLKTVDGKPTGAIGLWPDMAVTFIENHDTEPARGNGEAFPDDKVLQGYAYILTHPGIPCVFWRHFFDRGDADEKTLKALIAVRKRNHLTRHSVVDIRIADGGRYGAIVDGKVAMKIGPEAWSPGGGWHVAVDGNDFAVWEPN